MAHDNATTIDSSIYRDIFGTSKMRVVWSDGSRIQTYLDIESHLASVQAGLGIIPDEAAQEIARHCRVEMIDFDALRDATQHIGYPVLPVVQQLTAACTNGLGQWCHFGATTQDITDTATVLQIRRALDILGADLDGVAKALTSLAREHRSTPMIGRSNLQQAVPLTFGYKAAVWLAGVGRMQDRLAELRARVLIGQFGGAVGTLASLSVAPDGTMNDPRGLDVQRDLCKSLNLAQPPIAWHTVRDTIAEVGAWLGLLTGTLVKIATDIKIMMATEIAEVQEPDGGGGRGASSTMPQKRNPISCAYITSCAAVVRQHTAALLTAMDADFERATGTWEIEWIALPEAFGHTSGALAQARFMLEGLVVHPDAMLVNLRATKGLVNTEALMMALAPKLGRERAHDLLSTIAQRVEAKEGTLLDLLRGAKEISDAIDSDVVEKLLDPTRYIGLSEQFVDRVLALESDRG